MTAPIADFVRQYAARETARFHMPGHKGKPVLGCEPFDITEIKGADVLSVADGIIGESEANATALFGSAHTFYTTGGSTAAIGAMLAGATFGHTHARILAARNVHRAFVHAAALLDLDVEWLYSEDHTHACQCTISADTLASYLAREKNPPVAVYLTSPDYLGQTLDIAALSTVCHAHGVPLLVDNAHGAYLAFTAPTRHPLLLGADMCCDSAHKTLPVLTGGAYLHVGKHAPRHFLESARRALSLFTSTSPSYLVLQSLDLCNGYLATSAKADIAKAAAALDCLKKRLSDKGLEIVGDEPLKLTLHAAAAGYSGEVLAALLRQNNIEPEFADATHLVLMSTPAITQHELDKVASILLSLPLKPPLACKTPPAIPHLTQKLSLREAMLAHAEKIPVKLAVGRICASPLVSCPPAVPIVMCGEEITGEAVELLCHYGQDEILVVTE